MSKSKGQDSLSNSTITPIGISNDEKDNDNDFSDSDGIVSSSSETDVNRSKKTPLKNSNNHIRTVTSSSLSASTAKKQHLSSASSLPSGSGSRTAIDKSPIQIDMLSQPKIGDSKIETLPQFVHPNIRSSHKVDDPVVALCELVDNSIQALLEVSDEKGNDLLVDVKQDKKSNSLEVFDTGCGMTKEQLRAAGNMGAGGREYDAHGMNANVSKPFMNTKNNPFRIGEIGRYGIGKMAPYSLGKRVLMETKHSTSSEVNIKEEIVRGDKIEISITSRAIEGELEKKYSHWTRVIIKDVNEKIFKRKIEDEGEKSILNTHKDITVVRWAEQISMKYHLFLHGIEIFPDAMRAFIYPNGVTLPKIRISLADGSKEKLDLSEVKNPLVQFCDSLQKLVTNDTIKCWKLPGVHDSKTTAGILCLGYFNQIHEFEVQTSQAGLSSSSSSNSIAMREALSQLPDDRQLHVFANGIYLSEEILKMKILESPARSKNGDQTAKDYFLLKMGFTRVRGILFLTTKADKLEAFAFEKHKRSLERNDAYEQLIKGEGNDWRSIKREVHDFVRKCAEKDSYLLFSKSTSIDIEENLIEWKIFAGPFGVNQTLMDVSIGDYVQVGNHFQLCQVKQIKTKMIDNIPTDDYVASSDGVVEVVDAVITDYKFEIKPLIDIKKIVPADGSQKIKKEYEKKFPGSMEIIQINDNEIEDDNDDEEPTSSSNGQQSGNKRFLLKCNQFFRFKVKIYTKDKKKGFVNDVIMRLFKLKADIIINNERISNIVKVSRDKKGFTLEGTVPSNPGAYTIECALVVGVSVSSANPNAYQDMSIKSDIEIVAEKDDVNHLFLCPYRGPGFESTLSQKPERGFFSQFSYESGPDVELPLDTPLSFRIIGKSKDKHKYPLTTKQIEPSSIQMITQGKIKANTSSLQIEEYDGDIILKQISFESSSQTFPIPARLIVKLKIKGERRSTDIGSENDLLIKFVDPTKFIKWTVETEKIWIPGEVVPASRLRLPYLLESDTKFNLIWIAGEETITTPIEILNKTKNDKRSKNSLDVDSDNEDRVSSSSSKTNVHIRADLPEFRIPQNIQKGEATVCLQTHDKLFNTNIVYLNISVPTFIWTPSKQVSGVITKQGESNLIIAKSDVMSTIEFGSIDIEFPEGSAYEHDTNAGDDFLNGCSYEFKLQSAKKPIKGEMWKNGRIVIQKLPIKKTDREITFSMFGCDLTISLAQNIKLSSVLGTSPTLTLGSDKVLPEIGFSLFANDENIPLMIPELEAASLGVKLSLSKKGNELFWNGKRGQSIEFFPLAGDNGFLSDAEVENTNGLLIAGLTLNGTLKHNILSIELITDNGKSWSEKLPVILIPSADQDDEEIQEEAETREILSGKKKRIRDEPIIDKIVNETETKRQRIPSVDASSSSSKAAKKGSKSTTNSIPIPEISRYPLFDELYGAITNRDEDIILKTLEKIVKDKKSRPNEVVLADGFSVTFGIS